LAKRDGNSLFEGPRRLRTLLVLCAIAFLCVVARLFTLQIIHHEEYAQFARDNQLQRERIQGPRGVLRDRYGTVIIDNTLNFQVTEQWRKRDDVLATVRKISAYIPVDTTREMARFDAWQKRYGRVAFPLFPDADKFVISYVRENWMDYPELKVETHLRRRYPGKDVAAHVFGYVGEVTPDEVLASDGQFVPGDLVGKAGLERVYEDKLRGIPGQRAIEVTASGQSLGEVSEWSTAPVPGHGFRDADVPGLAPRDAPQSVGCCRAGRGKRRRHRRREPSRVRSQRVCTRRLGADDGRSPARSHQAALQPHFAGALRAGVDLQDHRDAGHAGESAGRSQSRAGLLRRRDEIRQPRLQVLEISRRARRHGPHVGYREFV
jgi:hypothetical protein